MKYKVYKNKIVILGKEDFNSKDIFDCGQMFRATCLSECLWEVRVADKQAIVEETENGYEINCTDVKYFENYFDLKRDYSKIKENLSNSDIIKTAISAGQGVRLVCAPFLETAVSFIISANNNMKRIKLIINKLCERIGEEKDGYYSFPTKEMLMTTDENFWQEIGAGYRSSYLPKAISQLAGLNKEYFENFNTQEARNKLISFAGIGPKVADCILLFGLQRFDVFPVDVWIAKLFNKYFDNNIFERTKIAKALVEKFGDLSGFAQQYLFNYRTYLMKNKSENII